MYSVVKPPCFCNPIYSHVTSRDAGYTRSEWDLVGSGIHGKENEKGNTAILTQH